MGQIPIVRSTFPEYVSQLDTTLAMLDELGVRWKNTRLDRYRQALDEAANASYPRVVDFKDPSQLERDRLRREAAIQCEQLMVSSEFWSEQPAEALKGKLKHVLSGGDLPPSGKGDDPARNTLAELATAALLRRRGFGVRLTENDEDVVAEVPELDPFAIECKRPASEAAIESNLKDMRKQLKGRCRGKNKRGVAVLAVDRFLKVSGGMLNADSEAHLQVGLDTKMRSVLDTMRSLVTHPRRSQLHLFPETPFIGALFVGTVFLLDRGMPVTVGLLSFASSAPDHAANEARPMVDVVQRYMSR